MTIVISSAFDSGNIRHAPGEAAFVDLEIEWDQGGRFYQWFSFRVAGGRDRELRFRIINAAGAAFPSGWPDYQVRVSTDRVSWRVTPTRYVDGRLEFKWHGTTELVWFAYFAPFTMDMHEALIAHYAGLSGVTHRQLGHSLDGQAIDCLVIGSGRKPVWLYGRQHPGEPMAEWWMAGALDWLTSPSAAALRDAATLHIVPNMNPDGTRRGHHRTNAAGVDLNREWHAPSAARSPEVLCVREAMDATGVAFAMDIHGDEGIPANFLVGFEGVPSWTEARGAKFSEFQRRLADRSPDFQTELGYGVTPPGKANLALSTNQLAERFGAVSMTLEMPFKDCAINPDPEFGWSGQRSQALGQACIEVLASMIDGI